MHFAKTATGTGKILGGHKNSTAINLAKAGNNAIRLDLFFVHSKQGRTVLHKQLYFLKGAFVEKQVDSLSSCQLSPVMLFLNSFLAAHGQ